jgi:quinol monooxygenase YgiN
MLWTSLLSGGTPALHAQIAQNCCKVLELRQYTLYPGKRDVLIDLFEREFIESQEAVGAQIVGQFRDLDNPDRFVWLRGFQDMDARLEALQSFYGGPVWKAHREEANTTMADSSNVMLLRRVNADSGFPSNQSSRPAVGSAQKPALLVVATVYYLKDPVDDAFRTFFERQVKPLMTKAGARPIAYFETETAENNYPRLPVRTGENVFVWFSSFANAGAFSEHLQRLEKTKEWSESVNPQLSSHFKSPPEHLRLEPTPRSLLR